MFGLLVSGRLVDTAFRQVDQTHFVIDVADPDSFNHVVVFLTGQVPFPAGMGGAVYCAWPPKEPTAAPVEPVWQFLGVVTNEKPSAIFKVSRLKKKETDIGGGMFGQQQQMMSLNAQVGISVESLETITSLATSVSAETSSTAVSSFMEFSQKMVESLFNYTASFAVSSDEVRARSAPASAESFVPFSAIQQWYKNFERRLQQNPNFWKN